jgi:hypothetical protein
MAFTKKPGSLVTGRVSNSVVGLRSTPNEIAKTSAEVHEIRVRFLSRRFGLAPHAAHVVASLAWEAR